MCERFERILEKWRQFRLLILCLIFLSTPHQIQSNEMEGFLNGFFTYLYSMDRHLNF